MSDLYPADEEINYTENAERPQDEGRVNWHLRKRNEAAREIGKTEELFRAEIAELQLRLTEITAPLTNSMGWHDSAVESWHRAMHADGQVGVTVKLPHGTSKLGSVGKSLAFSDEEKVLAWIQTLEDPSSMLTVPKEPTPAKAAIKKFLKVSPSTGEEPGAVLELVNPDTGEVVDGVTIQCGTRSHTAS